mgnify:CR=1 FL=1
MPSLAKTKSKLITKSLMKSISKMNCLNQILQSQSREVYWKFCFELLKIRVRLLLSLALRSKLTAKIVIHSTGRKVSPELYLSTNWANEFLILISSWLMKPQVRVRRRQQLLSSGQATELPQWKSSVKLSSLLPKEDEWLGTM